MTEDAKILLISVAARMAGMHPQTLRQYDRLGLVCPERTPGGGRRYSVRDVAMLREIQRLSQDEGVNLAGVKRIIDLEATIAECSGSPNWRKRWYARTSGWRSWSRSPRSPA